MTREHELIQQGWEKRTVYDEPRLSEIVEAYREMGYEVHLEPFQPDDAMFCQECMKVDVEQYKIVYTRKKS